MGLTYRIYLNGQHGRAYLFDTVVNVEEGPSEDRSMTTGLHTVKDIFCSRCRSVLGWKYVSTIVILLFNSSGSIVEPARPVKGTHDRFDNDLIKSDYIRKIEFSQVFERTLGSDSDIVGKELYRFKDKEDDLTLRPEGTAGIVRSLISNNLDQELPRKYYYHGSMFRHEKPQKGRLRQFEQFGVEMFGHDNPTSDIELIDMAMTFLNKIGLNDKIVLEINSLADMESRTRYKEVVRDYLRLHETDLSEDSLNRIPTNPLRVLDSKHRQDQPIIKNCPPISEYYNSSSTKRFEIVCQGLVKLDIPYKINHRLTRFSKLSHFRWAAGIDRLALILDESCIQPKTRPVAIISSLKYILGNILKSNASHAILIGEEEFKKSQNNI
ncbi:8616_t:CDS:10 [Diversispora eburnea]|uniref:histidine--tRNA ligase n=1 Tax=Diversispora eburnea TaxID=1213867 RepID=A0A9N9FIC4_9GLOM|nr:8616_t:CDS:10 [Diversispora eburnea]